MVYFTALFPFVIMIIFLVRAVTLSGFYYGLIYLFWPKVCGNVIFVFILLRNKIEIGLVKQLIYKDYKIY